MVILIADDDEGVRYILCRRLRTNGHTVIAAGDGEEALEAICAHPGPADLAIIDVVMPRMGGLELCSRIAAERPGTRLIVMSAGTKGKSLAAKAGLPFLKKPFMASAAPQAKSAEHHIGFWEVGPYLRLRNDTAFPSRA